MNWVSKMTFLGGNQYGAVLLFSAIAKGCVLASLTFRVYHAEPTTFGLECAHAIPRRLVGVVFGLWIFCDS
jgi:hypothetical protein